MSIRTVSKLLNPTCVTIVMTLLALVFMASFWIGMGRGAGGGAQTDPAMDSPVIVTVAGAPLTRKMIDSEYSSQTQNLTSAPGPAQMADGYATVLASNVNSMLAVIEAKNLGIEITPDMIKKSVLAQFQTSIQNAKLQMMIHGQLAPNATDAQFSDAVKKQTGKSLADLEKAQEQQTDAQLQQKGGQMALAASVAPQIVTDALAKKLSPTEDQVKATYVTLSVQRIYLTGSSEPADLAAVQAAIKAGQPFASLVDRYTKDTVATGKKPSQVPTTLTQKDLMLAPLNGLLTLKPGQISDPLTVPGGVAIYKILSSKPSLPKDFQKNFATYQSTMAKALADQKFSADLIQLSTGPAVQWSEPGWQALFIYKESLMNPSLSPDDLNKQLTTALQLAASPSAQVEGKGATGAALAYYAITQLQFGLAKGAAQDALLDQRIKADQLVAQFAPSAAVQVELAQLFMQKKDWANAVTAITQAASMNTSVDQSAVQANDQITAVTKDLVSLKKMTPDQVKVVEASQKGWQQTYTQYLQAKAQSEAAQQQAMQQAIQQAKKGKAGAKPGVAPGLSVGPPAPPAASPTAGSAKK